jgi:5-methyltetrahydrofolate--homocysteine methyltransferase
VKIMTGGAPVTAEYAKQIGADGYSVNASVAAMAAKPMIALEVA